MSVPTVSVVTATYNYGRFLPQALDSIRAQTFTDWEAIVIDDGSTDNTRQLMASYQSDSRFRFHCLNHRGPSRAKNSGIELARGRYVAFLDADDIWFPEKLARQIALLESQRRAGVVYCPCATIDPENRPLVAPRQPLYRGEVLAEMFLDNFVCFSSAIVRREVFKAVGGFDERNRLAIDYDLWLRVAQRFWFDYVDEPMVLYRTGHASLSRHAETRFMFALLIMRRFLDESEGRRHFSPSFVRRAFCSTYCNLGLIQRERRWSAALRSYLHALTYTPLRYEPWRALVALALPEAARRMVRRLLRRPPEWHIGRLAGEIEPGTSSELAAP